MATFGQGVNASLGKTDYSNYLAGALQGARSVAGGGQAIGQGVQNALSSIGVGVQKYMKNKEEQLIIEEATDTISPLIENPTVRKQFNIPEGATPEAVRQAVKKQVRVFGPAAALQLAREARQSAAFAAGINAIPQTTMETVEYETIDTDKLAQPANFSAPTSLFVKPPQQSVESFIENGLTPQAPAMAIDMISKQPAAPDAATETPAIKPVPKNIEPYFAFNARTGSLVPKRKFERDTLASTSDFQKLEQEKERINSELERGYKSTFDGVGLTGSPEYIRSQFSGDDIESRNQRLAEIEQQQAPLKDKLIELANVRETAADFRKQPEKKPSVEETASNVIDRSLRFAEEVDLDPIDKNQWLQMKTVVKDIPRKATDEEKIAAFVKGYGEIAPIDSGVYFKMKQLFDTAPVITDLGGGNQVVTANGQSFIIRSDEKKPLSVAQQKMDRKDLYSEYLIFAKDIGLEKLRNLHPQIFRELEKLHIDFGSENKFTNMLIPLSKVVASLSGQPVTSDLENINGKNNRKDADRILAGG